MQRFTVYQKNIILFFVIFVFVFPCLGDQASHGSKPTIRVIFDDSHGQTYGNADWVIDGGYSEFADHLRSHLNASVGALKYCAGSEQFSSKILRDCDVVVLPEPNTRYSSYEIRVLREFILKGGGIFFIADHGGSDRNFDGYDSAAIFNEILIDWGITFVGDTWSEAPLKSIVNPNHPVLRGVGNVGAWAATSMLVDKSIPNIEPLINSTTTGEAFLLTAEYGKGRIIVLGDSSPFDDGSGTTDKALHDSYGSWLYNHPALAIQSIAWLARTPPVVVDEIPPPYPLFEENRTRDDTKFQIIIDGYHGNTNIDILTRFVEQTKSSLNADFFLNRREFSTLQGANLVIITNPTHPLGIHEIESLKEWVCQHGGRLLVTSVSARNALCGSPNTNALLEGLGSQIRVNADEIMDYKHNNGKPWSIVCSSFTELEPFKNIRSAIFWSSASLVTPENQPLESNETVKVFLRSDPGSKSQIRNHFYVKSGTALRRLKSGLPVAAMERLGTGTIVVLGANPLSNYQYPTDAEKAKLDPVKWDYDTPSFNKGIVLILKE